MLYIVQNDPDVPPGIIAEELDRLGAGFTVVHPYNGEALPEPSALSAVIVLGGAMGANDDAQHPFLGELKRFIADVVGQGRPYLGICLGGQLLAAALGSDVRSDTNCEKGTYSVMLTDEGAGDRLFQGISPAFITFQWHNDSFEIPQKGVRLAFSASCHNQAFRIGARAWGLQFHPEVDVDIVRNWSSWTPETAAETEKIVADFRERETEYLAATRRMLANFLAVARG